MADLESVLQGQHAVLMEAAVVERLRRNPKVQLHPRLEHALLIRSERGRAELARCYSDYLQIARTAAMPIMLCTPTWRANRTRLAEAGIAENLNAAAVQFMRTFPAALIGGLIGCKNDCYKPEEALPEDEAEAFHAWQIQRLTDADFLLATTLPELGEARGIARAMARTDRPYLISFVINRQGLLLDGHALETAIHSIDACVDRPPAGYMINCAYPSFLQADQLSASALHRLLGIQANASSRDHTELDGAAVLKQDDLTDWGGHMLNLHRTHGLRILGGCCGTGTAHLDYLARHLGGNLNMNPEVLSATVNDNKENP